jgi:site-specific DNA-cytosine methylase
VLQVGNIVDTGNWNNPQRGRIYSAEGCSPASNTVGGGGLEPKILTPQRTEYGKVIRKQYEAGEIKESRHNMTALQPRQDGNANTLTSVQKDNLLLEPKILEDFYSNRDARVYEDCPTLRSERNGLKVMVKEATIQKIGNYHESNHEASRIVSSEGLAPCVKENHGTVTAVAVREATKLGYAIAEPGDSINIAFPNSDTRKGRVQKECTGTLETSCNQAVIQKMDIPQTVSVRKYVVDTPRLIDLLRSHKHLSNKDIAEKLDKPTTLVEHWFRNDSCFAIPDADVWMQLKELLRIETDEFDQCITEFEERDGVYEKANRCYHEDGIAPTLTSTSADEKVITDYRIRKLTPKECFRLMGFSDEDYQKCVDIGISNSQLYKQAGNSIVVNVLEEIFKKLQEVYICKKSIVQE